MCLGVEVEPARIGFCALFGLVIGKPLNKVLYLMNFQHMVHLEQKYLQNQVLAVWMQLMEDPELGGGSKTAITTNILAQDY